MDENDVSLSTATRSLLDEIGEMEKDALTELDGISSGQELEEFRTRYLGRKGLLTKVLRRLGELPQEERSAVGQRANALRRKLEEEITRRNQTLRREALARTLEREQLDVTLPGLPFRRGTLHPLTLALREIVDIFAGMGFSVFESREVETDEMNFVLLNIPPGHPARDMQATFYVNPEVVLRTQTSPGQIRGMRTYQGRLPVRFVVPGRVYRRDPADVSHHPVFHQIEGIAVDRDISFPNLVWVLEEFARRFFGPDTRFRLCPSYFPFTEPSAQMDVSCIICRGKGCSVCKYSGWLEVAGAGMVHPVVLRNGGYDPTEVTGFAFGMGLERLAMLKLGIDDIRLFYSCDTRFLRQFA